MGVKLYNGPLLFIMYPINSHLKLKTHTPPSPTPPYSLLLRIGTFWLIPGDTRPLLRWRTKVIISSEFHHYQEYIHQPKSLFLYVVFHLGKRYCEDPLVDQFCPFFKNRTSGKHKHTCSPPTNREKTQPAQNTKRKMAST